MFQFKFIIEHYVDGFVAYPLGFQGAVVGQGETHEAALADAKSAVKFHIKPFGIVAISTELPLINAFLAEVEIDL